MLKIEVREEGDVTILDLNGEIVGYATYLQLKDSFRQVLFNGSRKIILNMTKTTNLHNDGVFVLLDLFMSIRHLCGDMKLILVPGKAKNKLENNKMLTVFKHFSEKSAAIASFRNTAA